MIEITASKEEVASAQQIPHFVRNMKKWIDTTGGVQDVTLRSNQGRMGAVPSKQSFVVDELGPCGPRIAGVLLLKLPDSKALQVANLKWVNFSCLAETIQILNSS